MRLTEFSPSFDRAVCHIRQPAFPQFRFEWHPQSKNVYFIPEGSHTGHCFAQNIEDQGRANMAVLIFLRGYRQALAEMQATPWEPPKTSPIPPVAAE